MSIETLKWALEMGRVHNLEPTTRHILLILGNRADETGGGLYPSVAWICHRTGLSDRTVRTHLQALEKAGLLVRTERWREDDNGRTSDQMQLSIPPLADFAGGVAAIGERPRQQKGRPPLQELPGIHKKETKEEGSVARAPKKALKRPLPEGFQISDAVKEWAARNGHSPTYLQQCFDAFVDDAGAHGRTYVNWDLALQGWVRRQPQFERNGAHTTAARQAAPRRSCDEPGCSADGKYGVLGKLYCIEHFHKHNDAALARQARKPAGATT